jgi:uncharacterized membrane protein YhaH (DUF805 family)
MAVVWCTGLFLAISTRVGSMSAIGLAAAAILVVGGWATTIRRLHDRNKSGWWIVPFYVLPFAADMALLSGRIAERYPLPAAFVSLAGLVMTVWALVELGFVKGTAGTNRYGPDPVSAT